MNKKLIKVLVILFMIILAIVVGDYIYLETQISKEKMRIENEKNNEFIIDDYNKIEVICNYDKVLADAWEKTKYCIDLETNTVETKSSSGNSMPLLINKLLIWDKKRVELKDLKWTQYNKVTNTKVLSNEEKQQLVELISRVCDEEIKKTEEDNKKGAFGGLLYEIKISGEYKITTKDKKDILMDNIDDKKLFLKLVE